ncbi:MAG: hypothetical protein N3A66_04165 [Planctomycetota bacterium]|nr:hypothetical protein [Planctomycetota bacterium]
MANEKNTFAFLNTAPPEMVARLLANEDQMVAGAILAHAPPTATAKILAYMGADRQRQMVEMIRKGRRLPVESAERLAAHFQRRLAQVRAAASSAAPAKSPSRPTPTAAPQPWRPRRIDVAPVNAPPSPPAESKRSASSLALAIAQVRRLAQSGAKSMAPAKGKGLGEGNRAINGEALAAAILRLAPRAVRQNIAENDPELYNLLRGRMFIFDDLEHSPDEALAMIFTAVDLEVAVQALRFGSPRLQERVFAAVSPRRASLLREEMGLRREQRVRLADIETAQQKVLEVALALQRQGKILIDPTDPDVLSG